MQYVINERTRTTDNNEEKVITTQPLVGEVLRLQLPPAALTGLSAAVNDAAESSKIVIKMAA